MLVGRALALVVVAGCGRFGFGSTDSEDSDASTDGPDAGPVACETQGLVLYMRFDEASGITVTDSSGAGNSGAIVGSAEWVDGRVGGALEFFGADLVSAGSAESLDDLQTLTVCSFLQFDEGTPFSTLVDKSADGIDEGWNFYVTARRGLGFYSNHGAYRESVTVLPEPGWSYACATWDGTLTERGITLYLDGAAVPIELASQGGAFMSDAAYDLTIGKQKSGLYPLDGRLDELRIYNQVLGAAEILALYQCVTGT